MNNVQNKSEAAVSKVAAKRERLSESLLDIACARISESGLSGINVREFAVKAECSVGTIYNLFGSLDGLIIRANSVILRKLDAKLMEAGGEANGSPGERLLALAQAYLEFVAANTNSWYGVFEHKMPAGERIPEWHLDEHTTLFRHIVQPLSELDPDKSEDEVRLLARSIYSAVHGIVSLGLEDRLSAIPVGVIAGHIDIVVGSFIAGYRRPRA